MSGLTVRIPPGCTISNSAITAKFFLYDSCQTEELFVFRRNGDGKIPVEQDNPKYARASTYNRENRVYGAIVVMVCIEDDLERHAKAGDVFYLDNQGFFGEKTKSNIHLDISSMRSEFEYFNCIAGDPEEDNRICPPHDSFGEFITFATDVPNSENPAGKFNIPFEFLLGELRDLAKVPEGLIKNNPDPLSESHGCIHISPGDAIILNSWVKAETDEKPGSRIIIHKYGKKPPKTYDRKNAEIRPSYLQLMNQGIDPAKVTLSIYPKPDSDKIGGIGIISVTTSQGEVIAGYIKLTPGPEKYFTDSNGNPGGPTHACDTKFINIGEYTGNTYLNSILPGGVQTTFEIIPGKKEMVSVKDKEGKPVSVPLLYYRKFDYKKSSYPTPPIWIAAPKEFMQYLYDYGYINSSGLTDNKDLPFETRHVGKSDRQYYIGSSFGNGEILRSGERMPHLVFRYRDRENRQVIHYGSSSEAKLQKLTSQIAEFLEHPDDPPEIHFGNPHDQKYLSLIRDLINNQAKKLGLTGKELQYLIRTSLSGSIEKAERALRFMVQIRDLIAAKGESTSPEYRIPLDDYPIDPEIFLDGETKVTTKIFNVKVVISKKQGKDNDTEYTIIIIPQNKDTAYDKINLIAFMFGAEDQIPQTRENYNEVVGNRKISAQDKTLNSSQFLPVTIHVKPQ